MAEFNRRGVTFEEPVERRSRGSRFGDLGDRLARTFSKLEHPEANGERPGRVEPPVIEESPVAWDAPLPRFPISRQGYDCAAVDEHIAELEEELTELDREIAALRAQPQPGGEVAAEIERIGEQTSAILIAAHEQAKETTHLAQAQADRCIADAAANAIATTAEANRELRELESAKTSLGRERAGLLEDIRGVAAALSQLADDAAERFPAEADGAGPFPGGSAVADQPTIAAHRAETNNVHAE
jgi:hypothetical protein